MLKRLQWRFIRIAMGSTLLVFVFLLAAINVLSYGRLLQGADAMLRFISDNDGRLPEYAQVLSGDLRPEPAVHYTEETPFFTRFFVVHGDGTTVTDVEMERIAAVSETEAADFYVQALQQEKEYGFCGDYRYRAVAETRQRRLMLEIADGVEIRGDAAAIQQMLSLLLDNAVRYADEGTTIALRLYVLRDIILEVENGCTLPDDLDPERLFDRFYRVDTTRSRTTGGSGIGLSVARAIVEHHGGTLTAARHGRSICFRARFPQ